jgi:hypothetical protein
MGMLLNTCGVARRKEQGCILRVKMFKKGLHVLELGTVFFLDTVAFFEDRIGFHKFTSINTAGVQINED